MPSRPLATKPPPADDAGVLHLVPQWLPGSERFVFDLVSRTRRPAVAVSTRAVVNVERFPVSPLLSLDWSRHLPARWQPRVRAAALIAAARRHRVAAVHVHFGYSLHEALPLHRRRGLPLVVSLHGHDITGLLDASPGFYAGALREVDAVVVPSRFLGDRAISAGARTERVHVIPSGVDVAMLRPTPLPREPVVVFAGRFVAKKGLDVLAAAWPAVTSQVPGARLVVAGYGPMVDLATAIADELLLDATHDDVLAAIRRSRLVVTPSRTGADGDVESLLLVNLEAQALGRPLVSTRHGGIPEFVEDGVSAILVAESDPAALADGMVRVLTDDDLAHRLASHGPAVAARFDSAGSVRAVDDLYDRLLTTPARPRG